MPKTEILGYYLSPWRAGSPRGSSVTAWAVTQLNFAAPDRAASGEKKER